MIKRILSRGYRAYLAFFYKSISLAKGAKIDYRCEIDKKSNITIGEKSILYKHITIYKSQISRLTIGSHSHIAPYGYFLMGKENISIGENVAIAKNCSFFSVTNSIPTKEGVLFKDSYEYGEIVIGDNVFIGANSVILPNTRIEEGVVIGANSTVKGELEAGYLYGGNPARKIRRVFDV
jgi:acetyltransferase-like isoleucine patch superfamily enzyme